MSRNVLQGEPYAVAMAVCCRADKGATISEITKRTHLTEARVKMWLRYLVETEGYHQTPAQRHGETICTIACIPWAQVTARQSNHAAV